MAFHDVRLDDTVALNYVGGPAFQTSIVMLMSGHEARNINWSKARSEWNLGYPIGKVQFATIRDFFYARQGAAHSFRFKDWGDFELGDDATDVRQTIGVGDDVENKFQMFKRYSSGGINYDRTLTKIVLDTTRVWINAVEQIGGFTVNLLTGKINITVPPAGGLDVSALCEFDVPSRFAIDQLKISMPFDSHGSIPSIPIIEVRE